MGQISISNIINVSASQANLGANNYNTSNLALLSDETPATTFGTLGFKSYVDPNSVATDFGTASKTAQMATAVFSQQPNILNGNGQLIVILMKSASQRLALSGVPASGAFTLAFGGNTTTSLAFGATANTIQSALQLLPGLSNATVTGSLASQTLNVALGGVYGAAPASITIPTNTLQTSGSTAITFTVTTPTAGESVATAITRVTSLIQFFGVMVTETVEVIGGTDLQAAAAVIEGFSGGKIAFWVSNTEANIQPGGLLSAFVTGTQNHNRGLYYGDQTVVGNIPGINALIFMASYAGVALSVNFSGSNTTVTMNLKSLVGVQPDPSMSQTIYNEAEVAGADIYPSIQGDSAVISFGANDYYDNVYNLAWFIGAIQIASFNYLAQSNTKVPQTETGMSGLKGAQRQVCQQAVTNGFVAPGTWNSPTTFGVQALFFQNTAQLGYYIYTQPIAQQSQADRANRIAPVSQIAIKYAGAIQTQDIIVYVNP